jgi:hypothetical protein
VGALIDLKVDCASDPGSAEGSEVSLFDADVFACGPGAFFQDQAVVGLLLEIGISNDMPVFPFCIGSCLPMDVRHRVALDILHTRQALQAMDHAFVHDARQPDHAMRWIALEVGSGHLPEH